MVDPTPWTTAAFWGPFATEAECRPMLMGHIVTLLDEQGTDGSSDWLELP